MKEKTAPTKRVRDPDRTREKLLEAAFEEVHCNGFQAASLDRILKRAGVTKGALYHHFPTKSALGYALVDEVIKEISDRQILLPLARSPGDAITAIQQVLRDHRQASTDETVSLGCPLNNLAQEMSPLDESFRLRLEAAFATWREAFARVLAHGQTRGEVDRGIDADKVAGFIVAAFEGSVGLAKNARSAAVFHANMDVLCQLLDGLRTSPVRPPC